MAIYNLLGQLVLKSEIQNNADALNISSLPKGLFSCSVSEGNQQISFGRFSIVR